MDFYKFSLSENELLAMPSGALWWPAQSILCVSDLHLGKSYRLARMGKSWIPPYENQDTLLRLENDLDSTNTKKIICLGDSFDDNEASHTLPQDRLGNYHSRPLCSLIQSLMRDIVKCFHAPFVLCKSKIYGLTDKRPFFLLRTCRN